MSSGYVYVLSNPCMPGVVKIGHSNRSGRIRASEIYTTGVPEPFKLEFELFTEDCRELELIVHECLNRKRVSPGREFFRVGLKEAIACVMGEYACGIDYVVQHYRDFIDPSDLLRAMDVLVKRGHSPSDGDAASLYCHLDGDAIEAAYIALVERRKSVGFRQ